MQIKTVGVVGCGLMGSGIAQVCAASGYTTVVREVDETLLQRGLGRITAFLDSGVAKGKVTPAARDATLGNLKGTTALEDLKACDLIVEAIVEKPEAKQQVPADHLPVEIGECAGLEPRFHANVTEADAR
jgi:3-hydroxybutyryl-CoA dehydrogenase